MAITEISEEEAIHDPASMIARVNAGEDISIRSNLTPIAILCSPIRSTGGTMTGSISLVRVGSEESDG